MADTVLEPSAPAAGPTPGREGGATLGRAAAEQQEAFAGRLFEAALGALDLFAVYLGDRLGLYRALADGGPATPAELAARAGVHERYAREWLEQQAVTDVLEVADPDPDPAGRRYRLPAGRAGVLLDEESPAYLAPVARFLVAEAGQAPALLRAYRTGGGVPYAAYGADAREAQAAFNRPAFAHLLADRWLPALPDVHARLRAAPQARVADVGCGAGWASIALARAFPAARIDGFDADAASVALAQRNAAAAGVADRVAFRTLDVSAPATPGRADADAGGYDLVLAFETVHDLARPVEALATMRRLARPGGAVLVAEHRVGEAFAAPGDPIERLSYGISLLFCLPAALADGTPERPAAGTGTVLRPATLRRYARAAGFRDAEVLPIEHDLFRFYRLRS